jgi:hypothetical protein
MSGPRQSRLRAEKREYIKACKAKPCMDCGIEYPPYVMDFDHRDRSTKKFNIAVAADNNVSWDNLKTEIAKCDLVCSNCHRERTNKFGLFI